MEYVKLGNTGLDVSRFCLGCMSFGDGEKWIHPWELDEEKSRLIIKEALELGMNFFDTAGFVLMFRMKVLLNNTCESKRLVL